MSTQVERIKQSNLSEESGSKPVEEGDKLAWKFGKGMAEGEVAEVSESEMTRGTKPGVNITRKGNPENPAVYIDREGRGKNPVVKKQRELYKFHDQED
jgi:hypothetical protein